MYQRKDINNRIEPLRDNTVWLFVFLIIIGALLIGRLFYLQIIKHESYKAAAVSEQLKKFSIPADRGKIFIRDGDETLPIVLNEPKYLIFADPAFIDNSLDSAKKIQSIIGGSVDDIEKKLSAKSRYVELIKKADKSTKEKLLDLGIKGIVAKEFTVRSYPQAEMAAQVLGFVNDDGEGQYGIEEFLDKELRGEEGLLKAVTDIRGVPLAGNADNIVQQAKPGKTVTLTIDAVIQRIAEDALKEEVEKTKPSGASAIIMDVKTGAIRALANWPSYDPGKYNEVSDLNILKNKTVTDSLEMGSIMKNLTVAAAIDLGVVTAESSYNDLSYVEVEGLKITNAARLPAGTRTMYDILRYSLNSGAVYLLELMGGGEINQKARETWHDYLYENFRFGQLTGIEQTGETKGIVPDPNKGQGLNIQYANTSFGQGIAVSAIQMLAAQASIFNGGTYNKPTLIHSITDSLGKEVLAEPQVLKTNAVSKSASDQVVSLLEQYAVNTQQAPLREGFRMGGKTGTAQIPDDNGGYKEDFNIGTYAGFIGGKEIEYAVLVTVTEPKVSEFAGFYVARPIYNTIVKNMMDLVPFESK